MAVLLTAMGLVALGGLAALAAGRSSRLATILGAGGSVIGCGLGLVPALSVVLGSAPTGWHEAWDLPGGSFHVGLDALSGFFLVPTLLLSLLAAIYGGEYLRPYAERKSLGRAWFWFNLLVVSMVLVLIARNVVLFLVAWETMALSSFFLVTFEHERAEVREAGWTYLVATHLGTAFLLVMFLLLARSAGSFDFDRMAAVVGLAPALASLIFVLALVGFGTKAGFVPFHVWLPEAHPAAPSHVSAVMSGVMIKTGIYGLLRTLTFLGPPPAWWGWVLVTIGLTSGIFGVLFALAQHDLKRLLAYHSVENIGIITLGLGLGLVGVSLHLPALAVLGFAGGLLHVLNHALFKGLLFLGAGSVLHGTGTLDMDHLGGLLKRMPATGATFLVGAAAIAGLPPLNGFVSEFLIYLGAYRTVTSHGALAVLVPAALGIAGLALIGGLAAACFAKAFGIVFLGEPRGERAAKAHEAGWAMKGPLYALAAGCAVVGLCPWPIVQSLGPVLGTLPGQSVASTGSTLLGTGHLLLLATVVAGLVIGLVGGLVLLRGRLLARRPVEETGTWDCGYARPNARMQYTSSSFAQPLTSLFSLFLRTRRRLTPPEGLFPGRSSFATETPDVCREGIYRPAFGAIERVVGRLRVLQQGRVQLYVLYVVLTLLALLIWKMG
ncbi:MAG: oxidoreductase [Deltaproteobacteria bacterium]|nr:oxidoreductase [Deltaproteobacteria bacterium]